MRSPTPRLAVFLLPCGLLAAGCATQHRLATEQQLATARDTLAAAGRACAPPCAFAELQRAAGKLAAAERSIELDAGSARWLAEQAQVDAELVIARAAARRGAPLFTEMPLATGAFSGLGR